MARPLGTDELWQRVGPLIPSKPPDPRGGRPRAGDRACLVGIVFVLKTGIAGNDLPGELGVSGVTCWRRLRDWQEAGVWDRLLEELLAELNGQGSVDLWLAAAYSSSIRALKGVAHRPQPHRPRESRLETPRADRPTRYADRRAHHRGERQRRHDAHRTRRRDPADPRPRRRPRALVADKAYHSRERVTSLHIRGIEPLLPKRGEPDGRGLGKKRWVVERTLSWLHQFRRLRIRWERRADIHQAFLSLAAALICFRKLRIDGL